MILAKQYHPDRNPGREVDVVPKFQAIQAAHEILGDATQKDKYDTERAKVRARETDSPTFRKPAPPRRTDSGFPQTSAYAQTRPAPRRDPSETRYAPQAAPRPRPQSANTSAGDKFAQFARAAPPPQTQTWDKARFEAEGLRGMNAMRGGQMPQTSPLRPHHPTAPRSADPYATGGEPSPGFPGMGRTASQRRNYAPNSSSGDEPRSAYARYNRTETRPPSTGPYQNINPQPRREHESVSPLRQTRSFNPNDFSQHQNLRPGLSRTSSRYAQTGGERIDPNATNIGRSASVRNSPIDRERGPFGNHHSPEERTTRPRHRSHSPPAATASTNKFQYASESSSSEGEDTPPPQDRRKAPLRRAQPRVNVDDPGLTGYFPKNNYTRVVEDDSTYDYPAPDAKGAPIRKPFSNLSSPLDAHDSNANEPPFRTPSSEGLNKSRYDPRSFPFPTRTWPVWAIPSSIYPGKLDTKEKLSSIPEKPYMPFPDPDPLEKEDQSDKNPADAPDRSNGDAQTKPEERSKFSAEEWHEHFDNHADMFAPSDIPNRDRQSPTKNARTRAGSSRSYAPAKDNRRNAVDADIDPTIAAGVEHVNAGQSSSRANIFQPPKLAPDFVEQVNRSRRASHSTKTGNLDGTGYTNGNHRTPDDMDLDSPSGASISPGVGSDGYNVTVEEESSPIEKPVSAATKRHPPDTGTNGNGFNMNDLKQSGPFAPSESGLKDLDDLASNLPFKSRSADRNILHRTQSSTLRDLNLPRPPKAPHCPSDNDITSDIWTKFAESMTTYMNDWNKFNAAMVEHFRQRQEAVTHGMYRNWVIAWGDGATAEDFEASHGSDRAGYATYMTWLDDDKKCRAWWDVAFEDHIRCMEGLGRVRKCVKALNAAKET